MSDYEGDWDRDWEPVRSQISSLPPAVPPNPIHNYIIPKGTTLLEAQKAAQGKPGRAKRSGHITLPKSYRPALQGLQPGAENSEKHSISIPHDAPLKHPQKRVLELAAYRMYEAKQKPNHILQMHYTFLQLARKLPKHEYLSVLEVAKDELAKLCISTEAFIAVPDPESHDFKIWGTSEQVGKANLSLKTWEIDIQGPSKTKHVAWPRTLAFDGREEHRLIRENLLAHQEERFQQHANGSALPFEAHLIWPDGYDLEDFITSYDQEFLNKLFRNFQCVIRHSTGHIRRTEISCESQQSLFQVYNRLLGLRKEMVAKRRPSLRFTQCRLPSISAFRYEVRLRPTSFKGKTVSLPELTGEPLNESEAAYWEKLGSFTKKRVRIATKAALRSCIGSLHVSQKHVRMRVSFGSLGLQRYKSPLNGQDTYSIEEFIIMVQDSQVEVIQLPLVCGPCFDFIDRLESFEEFQEPRISWAVHFDFLGEQGGTLRHEREFVPNHIDPKEPNDSASRWLEYSSDTTQDVTERLELNHIDLERVGFQFHVGSATLSQNPKIRRELRSFENNITLQPALNGLRFAPSKHVVFPPGKKGLQLMREITIAKYRYKDTKGTLEVRRVDTFPQRPGDSSSTPSQVDWFAVYYYEEWDSMMAKLADNDPGQDVEWKRELSTFFPKVVDEDYPKALPIGFKSFVKEVEEIQGLLSKALDGPMKTSDVNGH